LAGPGPGSRSGVLSQKTETNEQSKHESIPIGRNPLTLSNLKTPKMTKTQIHPRRPTQPPHRRKAASVSQRNSIFSAKNPKPIIKRSKTHQPPIINRYENRPFSPVGAYYRLFAVFQEFCQTEARAALPGFGRRARSTNAIWLGTFPLRPHASHSSHPSHARLSEGSACKKLKMHQCDPNYATEIDAGGKSRTLTGDRQIRNH
jgi:hypothetical protein